MVLLSFPKNDYTMKNILIVEDETIISFGYRLQLEKMGFDVIGSARSADEAREQLQLQRPDLIIMDIYLKGDQNGLDLAREIHQSDPIPVLFLTASTQPDMVAGIEALEGCSYLTKPINSDALMETLQTFLN